MRNSIRFFFFCLAFISAVSAKAGYGDTISVKAHNKVHLNYYGNFDAWGVFPKDTAHISRVVLFWTIGCPTGGCSDWDYTTRLMLRHRPGGIDSTLKKVPMYLLDGQSYDTLRLVNDTIYTYHYNTATLELDSTPNPWKNLQVYGDTNNPTVLTSSRSVWLEGWAYTYDENNTRIDSTFIAADTVLYQVQTSYYDYFDKVEEYEIARSITPYGGDLPNTWTYTYKIDVTDFLPLLHDSVQIRAFYDGYSDGFTITSDFKLVQGVPALKPTKVIKLWQGYFPYGDPNDPIENYLVPKKAFIDGSAKAAKLRLLQTGHGFGGQDACAEFCPKVNYVKVGGVQRFQNTIWKDDCGSNPIYPQAGTWIYDRANWCPGLEIKPYEHWLTPYITNNDSLAVDVDMESYLNQGNNFCGYNFSGHVILYDAPAFARDAGVEDIKAPSTESNYGRINPICGDPKVVIRNNGTDTILALDVSYGVQGGTLLQTTWYGHIAPMSTEEISLPGFSWASAANNGTFVMNVVKVNGSPDEYSYNNTGYSSIVIPPVYPREFYIYFKTNNRASENVYTIKDPYGNVVLNRSGLANNTIYRDTIRLNSGCYMFDVSDESGDGLFFPFDQAAGSGIVRFQALGSNLVLKQFNPQFGNFIHHEFSVNWAMGKQDITPSSRDIRVYPNPAQGQFEIDLSGWIGEAKTILVYDALGRKVYEAQLTSADDFHQLNMAGAVGIYTVVVQNSQASSIQKLVLVR